MIKVLMCGARDDRRLEALLTEVLQQLGKIMSALDDLKAEVAATISVEQSAVTLITGIAAQLQAALDAAANPDPAIVDLTAQLTAGANALAAAVSANTPASTSTGSASGSTDTAPPAEPAPSEPAPTEPAPTEPAPTDGTSTGGTSPGTP